MFKRFYVFIGLVILSACQGVQSPISTSSISVSKDDRQLSKIESDTSQVIKQFAVLNNDLFIVNDKGELINVNNQEQLVHDISTEHPIAVDYDRIAAVDKNGNFILWTSQKIYQSTIKISKHSQFVILPHGILAVSQQNNDYRLVRIETNGTGVKVTAISPMAVLPDARPVVVNFFDRDNIGHIAILTHPDTTTYPHAVLGDNMEAKQLNYLDRHTLQPLVAPLTVEGLVFEENKVNVLNTQPKQLVSVLSGNGQGARVVIVKLENQALKIAAQSTPLPHNRWQDVFTQDDKLFAVHMPHLKKELVHYQIDNDNIQHHLIGNNVSTHQIGSYDTNLVGITSQFMVLPQAEYHALAWVDKEQTLHFFNHVFSSRIIQIKSTDTIIYVLLNDGTLWKVQ